MASVTFTSFAESVFREVRLGDKLLLQFVQVVEQHITFNGGLSKVRTWLLMRRKPSVAMLVYDSKARKVVLVEQLRVSIKETMFELAAGSMEKDGDPFRVARTELAEEVGIKVGDLQLIEEGYFSPGGTDEYLYLFAADVDFQAVGVKHGKLTGAMKEGEDIRVHVFSFEEFFSMHVIDLKTSYARLWLRHKVGE